MTPDPAVTVPAAMSRVPKAAPKVAMRAVVAAEVVAKGAAAVVAVVAVIARLRVRFSENDLMPRANRCCLMPAQTPHSLP